MRLAAIDIGSNSVHMVVVEPTGPQTFEVVDREKRMVKLGAGAFRMRRLGDDAMAAAIEAIKNFAKLADSLGVVEILAVATSATREAENGAQFLTDVERESGIVPRIITGIDEAQLIFKAVQSAIQFSGKALVIDIGGGSVEIVGGDSRNVLLNASLKLGVQRLRDMMGDAPLKESELERLRATIRGTVQGVAQQVAAMRFDTLIGTSGTIRCLAQATLRADNGGPPRTLNTAIATLPQLEALASQLTGLKRADRASVKGIDIERTDTVHLGAVLIVELIRAFGGEEITICDSSLREGVILDALDRRAHPGGPPGLPGAMRHRNVLRLAYKYGQDTTRPTHIARLALQIFEQTHPLHDLNAEARELLEFSALLFSVGQFIAFKGYQNHSAYIIEYSALRGFTHEEIDVLANIVRFHRKRQPKKADLEALPKAQHDVVRVLTAILGLAVVLDRSHSQAVTSVRCELKPGKHGKHHSKADPKAEAKAETEATDCGTLWIWVNGADVIDFEVWAAQNRTDSLSKALGVHVEVEREHGSTDPEAETLRPARSNPPKREGR
jgi:exopolyphosphatase / guanosine-5'-triphosphate,3'-diphosphate pyrophosphatase